MIDDSRKALKGLCDELGGGLSPLEQAMSDHYASRLDAVQWAAVVAFSVDLVVPFLHVGTALVTEMVPAPPPEAAGDTAVAVLRDATRIKPKLDTTTGQASWDGARATNVLGKESDIDLGDGFQAVYRHYSVNDPAK